MLETRHEETEAAFGLCVKVPFQWLYNSHSSLAVPGRVSGQQFGWGAHAKITGEMLAVLPLLLFRAVTQSGCGRISIQAEVHK